MKELKYRMIKKRCDEDLVNLKLINDRILKDVQRCKEIIKEDFLEHGGSREIDCSISWSVKDYGIKKFCEEFGKETGVDIYVEDESSAYLRFIHILFTNQRVSL